MIDVAARFLTAVGFRGLVDIDLKRQQRRDFQILDVNPRLGGMFRSMVGEDGMAVVRAMHLVWDRGQWHLPPGQEVGLRLPQRYSNLTLVHNPVHFSWLSQVEILFGIVQRKDVTPAVASCLEE